MLLSRKNTADWDLRNELSKVNVRWALLLLVAGYFLSLYLSDEKQSRFPVLYISVLFTVTFVFNLIYNYYLYALRKKERLLHPSLKYLTMVYDLVVVTLLLYPTGGSDSMFFILYFVVLLSNGMRYGMRLAVTGVLALIFSIF